MLHLWRPVVVAVALAVGASGGPAARAQEPGDTEHDVAVGGRTLHLACTGWGTPTVLFDAGGPDGEGGALVVAQLGADVSASLGSRFCAYDRAGTGRSPGDPIGVRTFREAAGDLHTLLASDELGCPCVVIGESLGGSIALVALAADPDAFAGLVLLDAPFPGYLDTELGLASPDPEEAWLAGENRERLDLVAGFRQVTTPAARPRIPIVVVSHGAGRPANGLPPLPLGLPDGRAGGRLAGGAGRAGPDAGRPARRRRGHRPRDRLLGTGPRGRARERGRRGRPGPGRCGEPGRVASALNGAPLWPVRAHLQYRGLVVEARQRAVARWIDPVL